MFMFMYQMFKEFLYTVYCLKENTYELQRKVREIRHFFFFFFFFFAIKNYLSLRKHAYSNILKISPPKTENF